MSKSPEEVIELGAKRYKRKRLPVQAHERGWPGYPDESIDVEAHTRSYPDVWGEEVGAFTGPALPTNGSHIHEVGTEGPLDMAEFANWDTQWSPGSYEIAGDFWDGDPRVFHEIGARRYKRKRVPVMPHYRSMPGRFSFGPGAQDVPVVEHTRSYPDVWGEVGQSTFYELGCHVPVLGYGGSTHTYEIGDFYEIGAEEVQAFSDAFNPRLTGKTNCYEKDGNLICCAEVFCPATGTCMMVAVKTPLAPIEDAVKRAAATGMGPQELAASLGMEPSDFWDGDPRVFHEIGWGWSSIKNAAKTVGKKYAYNSLKKVVTNPAFRSIAKKSAAASKYLARGAKKVAQNPNIQKFAQGAAVVAATYYGVPPKVTLAATGVLFQAMNGDGVALDKVAAIASEAAAGNETAAKLKNVMSLLYKGGMYKMKPHLQQAQAVAQSSLKQAAAAKAQAVASLPPAPQLPGMPAGMFPFNMPGMDYGPPIEGWLYNVPYRTNIQSKELDVFGKGRNPLHLMRGLYHQGMAK